MEAQARVLAHRRARNGIEDNGGIHRAGVTHAEVMESAVLQRWCPALPMACAFVGGPQIRNRGTIGGNLAHGSPAGDAIPPLYAAAPVLELDVAVPDHPGQTLHLLGVDPFAEGPFRPRLAGMDPAAEPLAGSARGLATLTDLVTRPATGLLSSETARRLGIAPGGTLGIRVAGATRPVTVIAAHRPAPSAWTSPSHRSPESRSNECRDGGQEAPGEGAPQEGRPGEPRIRHAGQRGIAGQVGGSRS